MGNRWDHVRSSNALLVAGKMPRVCIVWRKCEEVALDASTIYIVLIAYIFRLSVVDSTESQLFAFSER